MSNKLASFQKDGEGAMTSLDLYILASILSVPSW